MATKRTSKKKGTAKKEGEDDRISQGDLAAFENLGVGKGDVTLRKLIMGQRRLNGRLLAANLEIKKVLGMLSRRIGASKPSSSKSKSVESTKNTINTSLEKIAEHLTYIGGDEPPGCQLPPRH
jgi:hypothetical protein